MLQPVLLRGAGGHSRQWAELCSISFKLFILPDSALFFYHFLPCLSSSLSLPPSAWPHRRWQPKSLTFTRCTVFFFLLSTGSAPYTLLFLHIHQQQTERSWTHLRSHKHLMIAIYMGLCLYGQGKGCKSWFLQQRWAVCSLSKEWKKTADTQAGNKRRPKTPN